MSNIAGIEPIRVTQNWGKSLDNLELLWFIRDEAQRRWDQHMQGVHLTAEEWAAVNTPDEAWTEMHEDVRPSDEWRRFKMDWFMEGTVLLGLLQIAQRNVRIATGHEPVKNLKLPTAA